MIRKKRAGVAWATASIVLFAAQSPTAQAIDITVSGGSAFAFDQIDVGYAGGGAVFAPNTNWANLTVVDPLLLGSASGLSQGYLNIHDGVNWIVQNHYVDTTDGIGDLTSSFDLGVITGTDVVSLSANIDFSSIPTNNFLGGATSNFGVGDVGWGAAGAGDLVISDASAIGAPGLGLNWFTALGPTGVLVSQPNPVNVQAAANQCFPMSMANSLQWLENEHPGLTIAAPHQKGLKGDNTLVGKLDANRNVTNRQNGSGMWFKPMLETKFDFLVDEGIQGSFDMKHQGTGYGGAGQALPSGDFTHNGVTSKDESPTMGLQAGKPTLEWIVQQLNDGEDVEVVWTYENSDGEIVGGHAVRVFEAGTTLGIPWLGYVHDAAQTNIDPTDTKGLETRREFLVDIDGDGFQNIGSSNRELVFAMAESYVPEPSTLILATIGLACLGGYRRKLA